MGENWLVLKKTLPPIGDELARDKVAELLKSTAAAAASAGDGNFESKSIHRPNEGVAFVALLKDNKCPADGWGWTHDETFVSHPLALGLSISEFTRSDSAAGILRKRYALSTNPDLQFVHYLKATPVSKEAKPDLKRKKSVSTNDDIWGFEDQSVPSLVSLARYKRNHEFINELLSPFPPQAKPKFESTVTVDDLHKLEAEIKELEEQNKILAATIQKSAADL